MKRIPRLVDEYQYKDILEAYFDCRRRKRYTIPALKFESNYSDLLMCLLDSINNGTYEIGPSRAFVVTWPKPREIWAAKFVDRIAHHLICRDLFPYYVPRFIKTNCACIRGRGTKYAVECLNSFCRSITRDWTDIAYYLKFDISNFFVSVDKRILWKLIERDLGNDSLTSNLFYKIIMKDQKKNAEIAHNSKFDMIPKCKSLWFTDEFHGLPIGDLTSQLCASGIYLNGLDMFIKHVLKCKFYVRYVDDAVILSKDSSELERISLRINKWLNENRRLKLSAKKTFINRIDSGIDFVGHRILPYRVYTRNLTKSRMINSARELIKSPTDGDLINSINSYLGLLRFSDSYNIRKQMCELVALNDILDFDEEYTKIFSRIVI